MKYIVPGYMSLFRCDGKLCGSYCCREWRVAIDEKARSKYELLPNGEREQVLSCIGDAENGFYPLKLDERGNCPFLGEDLLCRLQKNHGEDFLSDICFSYPRVTHIVGDVIEQSLTLSCPLAAEIVLFSDGIFFVETDKIPKRLGWKVTLTNRDMFKKEPLALSYFEDIESAGLYILRDKGTATEKRLAALIAFCEKADKCLSCEERLKKLLNSVESGDFQKEFSVLESYERVFKKLGRLNLIIKLFNALYEYSVTEEKLTSLRGLYNSRFEEFQEKVIDVYPQLFTNYLMNEFFMRAYPYAYDENFTINAKVFVLSWEALQFALFMLYVEGGLNEERMIFGIRRLVERMDHGRGVMGKILEIAKNDC